MAEPELLLDSNIRLWVVLPIVFITFLVGVIRHYVSILLQSDKKLTLEQVSDRYVSTTCCNPIRIREFLIVCFSLPHPAKSLSAAESSEKMGNTSRNRYVSFVQLLGYLLSTSSPRLQLLSSPENWFRCVNNFPNEDDKQTCKQNGTLQRGRRTVLA